MKTMEIGYCFQPDAKWSSPSMSGLTGGNDPTLGCRARSLALVVPALSVPTVNPRPDHSLISSESRMDRNRIAHEEPMKLCMSSRDRQAISIASECGRRSTDVNLNASDSNSREAVAEIPS